MLSSSPVHAVLPASDVDRAVAWWSTNVGMEPEVRDAGGAWYRCGNDSWFVITPSAFAGTAQNTAASFQVEDVVGLMGSMRERGVVFEEYDLPDFKTVDGLFEIGGFRAAWFRDSEGNIVEIGQVPQPH